MITKAAIALFISGMLIFLSMRVSDIDIQHPWMYYLWDKGSFFMVCLAALKDDVKKYKSLWFQITAFASLRLVWEVISALTGWDINNTKIVGLLFIILCVAIILQLLREWNLKP